MKTPMNTYMFASKTSISLCPTYHEVIAKDSKEATRKVKKEIRDHFKKLSKKDLIKLLTYEIGTGDFDVTKINQVSCGRADQYHSPAECGLCSSVLAKKC